MARQLAEQLRPELEAAVKRNDSAPGEAYSPDAASVRAGCCHPVHQPGLRSVSTNWDRTSHIGDMYLPRKTSSHDAASVRACCAFPSGSLAYALLCCGMTALLSHRA